VFSDTLEAYSSKCTRPAIAKTLISQLVIKKWLFNCSKIERFALRSSGRVYTGVLSRNFSGQPGHGVIHDMTLCCGMRLVVLPIETLDSLISPPANNTSVAAVQKKLDTRHWHML
jgi:hypothetical protein